MAPEYDRLYDHYIDLRKDLIIARIEASENDDIALRYGIFSFPRVVMFGPNEPRIKTVFDGRPRMLQYFIQWIEHDAPKIENKEKKEEPKKMLEEEHVVVQVKEAEPHEGKVDLKFNPNNDQSGEKLTNEIEFVKREMVTLRTRIDSMQETINSLKAHQDAAPKHQIEDHDKPHIYMPSPNTMVFLLCAFILVIATVFTIKKLFVSGVSHQVQMDKNI